MVSVYLYVNFIPRNGSENVQFKSFNIQTEEVYCCPIQGQ